MSSQYYLTHQASTRPIFTVPVSSSLATANRLGSLLFMARASDSPLILIRASIRWLRLSSLRLVEVAWNRVDSMLASTGRSDQ